MIVSNGDMPANPIVMENGHPYHASQARFENASLVSGLTKREAFAMAAMQGMIASGICTPPQDETIHHMTSMASVSYADALLKELEK